MCLQGTVSSKTPGILQQPGGINQPGGVKAQYYDKVVEGRLGGGEEVSTQLSNPLIADALALIFQRTLVHAGCV